MDIFKAIEHRNVEEVKQSLKSGADVNARLPNIQSTPLLVACSIGNSEIVALLLDHGADLGAMDEIGGVKS
jgi:ankyrin repeat protein